MTARRSVLAHPAILYAATVAAAVLAALGQQAIAQRWGDGWDWVDFGKAVFANGVIAILLAIVARALQREQDRVEAVRVAAEQRAIEEAEAARQESAERGRLLGQAALPLAISGWSKVPLEPGTIATEETLTPELLDNLADNAKQWRDLAEELNGLVTSRPASGADQQEQYEAGKIAFLRLSGLSNSMQLYLMEGGRRRRLIYLQWLANDLSAAASAGWNWSPSVYRFRNATVVLLGWVQHTDSTIVERLLVERVTHLFHPPPPANQWRDTKETTGLADSAVNADPVYLLVFYINSACVRIKETNGFADAVPLVDLVARSLGALRNEMRAAAECAEALLAVARETYATVDLDNRHAPSTPKRAKQLK